MTFGSAQNIGNKIQQWFRILLNCNQLLKLSKVVVGAFITITRLNIVFRSPEHSAGVAKTIRSILFLVHKVTWFLMPRESQKIARLAREIVSLKGRLAFLWNSERTRRERARDKTDLSVISHVPAVEIAADPLSGPSQHQILCAFLGWLYSGCLLSISCVSLGIWIGSIL